MLYCNEKKPYVFVSYSHKDMEQVTDIINRMVQNGYNVWFDEGIDPGTEWDETIAQHINGCSYFIAFISKNYIDSKNCKDELNYSRDLDKPQFLAYLEDVELPSGMAMRMNRLQSVFLHRYDDEEEAQQKIFSAAGLEVTKISDSAPRGWKPYGAQVAYHKMMAENQDAEGKAGDSVQAAAAQQPTGKMDAAENSTVGLLAGKKFFIGLAIGAVALIALIAALVLRGCGSSEKDPEDDKGQTAGTPVITVEPKDTPAAVPTNVPTETPTTFPTPSPEPTATPVPTPIVWKEYEPEENETLFQFPTWRPAEGEVYSTDTVAYHQNTVSWDGHTYRFQAGSSIGDVDDPELRASIKAFSVDEYKVNGSYMVQLVLQVEQNPGHKEIAEFLYAATDSEGNSYSWDTMLISGDGELEAGQFYKAYCYVPEIADVVIFMKMTSDTKDTYENYSYYNEVRHDYWQKEYEFQTESGETVELISDGTICGEYFSEHVICHIAKVELSKNEYGMDQLMITFQPEFDEETNIDDLKALYFRIRGYDAENRQICYHYFAHELSEEDSYSEYGFYSVSFNLWVGEKSLRPMNRETLENDYQYCKIEANGESYLMYLWARETGSMDDPEFRIRFHITGVTERDGVQMMQLESEVISNPNECRTGRFAMEVRDQTQKKLNGGTWSLSEDTHQVGEKKTWMTKLDFYKAGEMNYIHFFANTPDGIDVPPQQ